MILHQGSIYFDGLGKIRHEDSVRTEVLAFDAFPGHPYPAFHLDVRVARSRAVTTRIDSHSGLDAGVHTFSRMAKSNVLTDVIASMMTIQLYVYVFCFKKVIIFVRAWSHYCTGTRAIFVRTVFERAARG
jgi:hypothetical protein